MSATERRMVARVMYLDYGALIAQSERTIARIESEIVAADEMDLRHLTEALAAEEARLLRYQCAESAAEDDMDGRPW